MAPSSRAPSGQAGTTIWRPQSLSTEKEKRAQRCVKLLSSVNEERERYFSLPEEFHPSVSHQVLIQGLQNLNRAVHQDVVALQLFPQSQWVAPSSVLLQDEGEAKEDNADEEEEKVVNLCFIFITLAWPATTD